MRLKLNEERRWETVRQVLADDPYSLVFFVADADQLREAVLVRLRAWSESGAVPPLSFVTPEREDQRLFDTLSALSARREGRFGVVLHGLDWLVVNGYTLPALQDFNFGRDLLPAMIRGPFVLVLSAREVAAVQRSMGDFYSARTLECIVEATDADAAARAAPADNHWRDPLGVARQLMEAGRTSEAVRWAEQAMLRAVSMKSRRGEAASNELLGTIALMIDQLPEADSRLSAAAEIFRSSGDTTAEANCRHRLGEVAHRRADWSAAREHFERAIELYKFSGDVSMGAFTLLELGRVLLEQGNRADAHALIERAHDEFQRIGDRAGVAGCLLELGVMARRIDLVLSRAVLERALALYRELGHPNGVANSLHELTLVALAQRRRADALQMMDEALTLYRQTRDTLGEANVLWTMGVVARDSGDIPLARSRFESALILSRRIPSPPTTADLQMFIATLPDTLPGEANHRIDEAVSLFRSVGREDRAHDADAHRPPR